MHKVEKAAIRVPMDIATIDVSEHSILSLRATERFDFAHLP